MLRVFWMFSLLFVSIVFLNQGLTASSELAMQQAVLQQKLHLITVEVDRSGYNEDLDTAMAVAESDVAAYNEEVHKRNIAIAAGAIGIASAFGVWIRDVV